MTGFLQDRHICLFQIGNTPHTVKHPWSCQHLAAMYTWDPGGRISRLGYQFQFQLNWLASAVKTDMIMVPSRETHSPMKSTCNCLSMPAGSSGSKLGLASAWSQSSPHLGTHHMTNKVIRTGTCTRTRPLYQTEGWKPQIEACTVSGSSTITTGRCTGTLMTTQCAVNNFLFLHFMKKSPKARDVCIRSPLPSAVRHLQDHLLQVACEGTCLQKFQLTCAKVSMTRLG